MVSVVVAIYALICNVLCLVAQLNSDPFDVETLYISRLMGFMRLTRFPNSEDEWGFVVFLFSNLLIVIGSIYNVCVCYYKARKSVMLNLENNSSLQDPLMNDDEVKQQENELCRSRQKLCSSFWKRFANLPCITFVLITWCTVHPSILMLPLLFTALIFIASPPEYLRGFKGVFISLVIVYACLLSLLQFSAGVPVKSAGDTGAFRLDQRLGYILGLNFRDHFACATDFFIWGFLVMLCRCIGTLKSVYKGEARACFFVSLSLSLSLSHSCPSLFSYHMIEQMTTTTTKRTNKI